MYRRGSPFIASSFAGLRQIYLRGTIEYATPTCLHPPSHSLSGSRSDAKVSFVVFLVSSVTETLHVTLIPALKVLKNMPSAPMRARRTPPPAPALMLVSRRPLGSINSHLSSALARSHILWCSEQSWGQVGILRKQGSSLTGY